MDISSQSSFSPAFNINLYVMSFVAAFGGIFGIVKKFLEGISKAAQSYPRGTGISTVGLAWLFGVNMFVVMWDSKPETDNIPLTVSRASLGFAAVTLLLGPFLLLTPTHPIKVKGEAVFKKMAQEGFMDAKMTPGEIALLTFRWIIYLILLALHAFACYSLAIVLEPFLAHNSEGDLTDTGAGQLVIVVVAYALIAVILMAVLWGPVFGHELALGGISIVQEIRKNIKIKRTYEQKQEGKKDVDILAHKQFAKAYIAAFAVVLIALLALLITLLVLDVSKFSASASALVTSVTVFFIVDVVVLVWLVVLILKAAFRPVNVATEILMADGTVVSVDKIKHVCAARLQDRVALLRFTPNAKDPQRNLVERDVREEVKYSSVAPGFKSRKEFAEWGGAVYQENDRRCMFLVATGADYTGAVAKHFLHALEVHVAEQYYGYRTGFELHGPGTWTEPLRPQLEKMCKLYSDQKALENFNKEVELDEDHRTGLEKDDDMIAAQLKEAETDVAERWSPALLHLGTSLIQERDQKPASTPVVEVIPHITGTGDEQVVDDATASKPPPPQPKKRRRPPGAPPPKPAPKPDEKEDDATELKEVSLKARAKPAPAPELDRLHVLPSERPSETGTFASVVNPPSWPAAAAPWEGSGPVHWPSTDRALDDLDARVEALESAAGIKAQPWRLSNRAGQSHPALLVGKDGLVATLPATSINAELKPTSATLPSHVIQQPLSLVHWPDEDLMQMKDGYATTSIPSGTEKVHRLLQSITAVAGTEYYFETTITETGASIVIGFAFCALDAFIDLGVTQHTLGAKAESGKAVSLIADGTVKQGVRSVTVSPGDTLGAGWRADGACWFTHNGVIFGRIDSAFATKPRLALSISRAAVEPITDQPPPSNSISLSFNMGQRPMEIEKVRSYPAGEFAGTSHMSVDRNILTCNAGDGAISCGHGVAPFTLSTSHGHASGSGGGGGSAVRFDDGVYFEASVLAHGGFVAIGLAPSIPELPIWPQDGRFYRSDTGAAVSVTSQLPQSVGYGPRFARGDVVGCLWLKVDEEHSTISFFKNGTPLGNAFTVPSSSKFLPVILMDTAGSRVAVNLGTSSFSAYRQGAPCLPTGLLPDLPTQAVFADKEHRVVRYVGGGNVTAVGNAMIADGAEEYYFEVHMRQNSTLCIGLAANSLVGEPALRDSELGELQGTMAFVSNGQKRQDGASGVFGHTCTLGDVIGCGFNRVSGCVYFTRNGDLMGVAFYGVHGNFRPAFSMSQQTCIVGVNFGQWPFRYAQVGQSILPKSLADPPRPWLTQSGFGSTWAGAVADVPAEVFEGRLDGADSDNRIMFEASIVGTTDVPSLAIGWTRQAKPSNLGSLRAAEVALVGVGNSSFFLDGDQLSPGGFGGLSVGDTLGTCVHLETGSVSFALNGVYLGAVKTYPTDPPQSLYPVVLVGSSNTTVALRFGTSTAPLTYPDAFGTFRHLDFLHAPELAIASIHFEGEDESRKLTDAYGVALGDAYRDLLVKFRDDLLSVEPGVSKLLVPGRAALLAAATQLEPAARQQLRGRQPLSPSHQRLVDARLHLARVALRDIMASMRVASLIGPGFGIGQAAGTDSDDVASELRLHQMMAQMVMALRWIKLDSHVLALAHLRAALASIEMTAEDEPSKTWNTVRSTRTAMVGFVGALVELVQPGSGLNVKRRAKLEKARKKELKKKA